MKKGVIFLAVIEMVLVAGQIHAQVQMDGAPHALVALNNEFQALCGGARNDFGQSSTWIDHRRYLISASSNSTDIPNVQNHGGYDFYLFEVKAAGEPYVGWRQMYGGEGNDMLKMGQRTMDDGVVMVGSSNSVDIPGVVNYGDYDVYFVKLDGSGSVQWQQMYGGPGMDGAYALAQDAAGNYFIAGFSYSSSVDCDVYVLKLDSIGGIIWSKTYGGSGLDAGYAMALTGDGGCIVAGASESEDIPGQPNQGLSDYLVLKLDRDGEQQWLRLYGNQDGDVARAVLDVPDGPYPACSYIVAGSTFKPSRKNDAWALWLNSAGDVEWSRAYGGNQEDFIYDIKRTTDGGYIMCGDSKSRDIPGTPNKGRQDAYIIKIDGMGNLEWQRLCGGSRDDCAARIQEVPGGGYIVAGSSKSTDIPGTQPHGAFDCYIFLFSIWQ